MSRQDVIDQGARGYFEYALLIHGLRYLFVTGGVWNNPETLAGIVGDLVVLHVLDMDEWTEELEIDPKGWDLKASNHEFVLKDGSGLAANDRSTFALTGIFGRRLRPDTTTTILETISSTSASVKVADASIFTAPFDAYRGLETIGVDTIDVGATPDELQDLTRGKYGSEAQEHVYSLDPGGIRPEGDLIPTISDGPRSLHGRWVTLYEVHVDRDGNRLSEPEVRYYGRIMGNVDCQGETWTIPTENAWTALDSKIPSKMRSSQLREIAFSRDLEVTWQVNSSAVTDSITITTRRWNSAGELVAAVVAAINASIRAAAETVSLVFLPAALGDGGGQYQWWCQEDGGDPAEILILVFNTPELETALGFSDEDRVAGSIGYRISSIDGFAARITSVPVVAGVFQQSPVDPITVGCDDAIVYDAFSLVSEADGYDVRSFLVIGAIAFRLISVDAGTNELTITPFGDVLGAAWAPDERTTPIQYWGDPPLEIREHVRLQGVWHKCWKALIESTTIRPDFKGYVRSSMIDWDGIAAASDVLPECRRFIIEPESFRAMLLEDFAIRGILPTIRDGKISGIALRGPTLLGGAFVVDEDYVLENAMLRSTYSEDRVVNGLEINWRWDWLSQSFQPPAFLENNADSQQDLGIVNVASREAKGLAIMSETDAANAIRPTVVEFLRLFGADFAIIDVPVTFGAASVIPGDDTLLTDESVPDEAIGERGVTLKPGLVLGTKMTTLKDDGTGARGTLRVLIVDDGLRRSGFAPSARIASFVDNGAPAGDNRYELVIDDGFYSDVNEATFFLANYRVELQERDATASSAESRICSATGNNGTSVFLTAAPSAGMQVVIAAGKGLIVLDDFTTAGAVASQLLYYHVADETTGEIGASGVDGFSPS